jgi:hypothetical protein
MNSSSLQKTTAPCAAVALILLFSFSLEGHLFANDGQRFLIALRLEDSVPQFVVGDDPALLPHNLVDLTQNPEDVASVTVGVILDDGLFLLHVVLLSIRLHTKWW